jgi:hypothetical protein
MINEGGDRLAEKQSAREDVGREMERIMMANQQPRSDHRMAPNSNSISLSIFGTPLNN